MRTSREPLQLDSLGEPWATSVREALAARSVLRRSLKRWPVGPSDPSLRRLVRAVDDAVAATREAGEAARQLVMAPRDGSQGRRHPSSGPSASGSVSNGIGSAPQRLHDEALRLRLCVLDLDDIAVEAAEELSIGSPRLHRTSIELESRMAQVLGELRSVRAELQT